MVNLMNKQLNKIVYLFAVCFLLSCLPPQEEKPKSVNYNYNELLEKKESQKEEYVKMQTQGGVKIVSLEINDIPLQFVFDTGASSICISLREAEELVRQGTLTKEDIIKEQYFTDANGNVSKGMLVNLRKVKIGNTILRDVEANIVPNYKAPLLLGQTALKQFGTIEINNEDNIIILRK